MKLLLDENLPHALRHYLPRHEVFTVTYMGWTGLRNGALLARASCEGFMVLLTRDAGIPFQQNLSNLPMSILVLHPRSDRIDDLVALVPATLIALFELAGEPRPTVVSVG